MGVRQRRQRKGGTERLVFKGSLARHGDAWCGRQRPLCLSWRSVNASGQPTARLGLLTLIRLYVDLPGPRL